MKNCERIKEGVSLKHMHKVSRHMKIWSTLLVIREVRTLVSYYFILTGMAWINHTGACPCFWECGEADALCPGIVKYFSPFGRRSVVPWIVTHRVKIWPSNFTPRYILREMKTHVYVKTSTWMFIAALFTVAKKWGQSSYIPTSEWINKMCCI